MVFGYSVREREREYRWIEKLVNKLRLEVPRSQSISLDLLSTSSIDQSLMMITYNNIHLSELGQPALYRPAPIAQNINCTIIIRRPSIHRYINLQSSHHLIAGIPLIPPLTKSHQLYSKHSSWTPSRKG